jgi:mRNA interferase MazF
MDKVRPVLILTRRQVIPYLSGVTVVPITSTIRGLSIEVGLGRHNGLIKDSVANCENITTIDRDDIRRHLGFLLPAQEPALARAMGFAFGLYDEVRGQTYD